MYWWLFVAKTFPSEAGLVKQPLYCSKPLVVVL